MTLMSVGISQIATVLPNISVNNEENAKKFDIEREFLYNKIGVVSYRVLASDQSASDIAKGFSRIIGKVR